MSYYDRDSDFDPYLDAVEDRDEVEMARERELEVAAEDAEADRFEYLAGFATLEPRYVFTEQADGSFTCTPRVQVVCQNLLLPFAEVA